MLDMDRTWLFPSYKQDMNQQMRNSMYYATHVLGDESIVEMG